MNRPRWRKIFSDLWGNRSRSALVIASIMVGLFAIGVITLLYIVIAQDMRTAYRSVNPANIYITAGFFDQDLVDRLERMEGVREAQGIRPIDLRVKLGPNEWKSFHIIAHPNLDEMTVNQVRLVEGVWPPKKGEVVLEQYKMDELNAQVGSILQIELPSGKLREVKVVGVVQDLTLGAFLGGAGFFYAPSQGYMPLDFADKLEQIQPEMMTGLYLTVDGDGDDLKYIQAVASRVSEEIEQNGVEVTSSTARTRSDHPNGYLVDAIVGVLFVLGFLVVFLSGFLITNTLQALLNQQVQQIGIMKTVGGRRLQIVSIYVALMFVFGLLAFVIAVPLAYEVSYVILNFLSKELNFVLTAKRIEPAMVIVQAAMALLMPQVAAWLPIQQGTSISVQEALSGIRQGESPQEAGGIARRLPRIRNLSRPMLISIRNTFRHKWRLLLTLITLTLGGAIFIATFNVQVSMDLYVEQISRYFLADVNVTLDRPYRNAEIEQYVKQVPGVAHVEGWAAARSELVQEDGSAGEQVSLVAPPATSTLVEPIMIEGRWIQEGDRNAITLSEMFLTRYPGLKLGDTINLQVNGKNTEWVVVGIYQFAGKNGGYSAYTSYDYLSELTGQVGKSATFRVVADRSGLSGKEQERLGQRIEEHLEANGIHVAEVNTGSFMSGLAAEGFAILTSFLLFLAVLTALVGSFGLAGTMSMNVMERTREIGVLRAIGASDRILMKLVLVEGMMIGLFSYALGALLAFPISKLLSDAVSLAIFETPSNFGYTITGFVIWLGAVLLLSFVASVVPARSASRLTIREVLAYE